MTKSKQTKRTFKQEQQQQQLSPLITRKEKRSKKIKINKLISSTGISNEINIEQINRPAIQHGSSKKSAKCNRAQPIVSQLSNLKYPIKFYPNMRVKDINRLVDINTDLEFYHGSVPMFGSYSRQQTVESKVIKPSLNNFYIQGDYKFWIV